MFKIHDRTGTVLYEVEAETMAAAVSHIVRAARGRREVADFAGAALRDAVLRPHRHG